VTFENTSADSSRRSTTSGKTESPAGVMEALVHRVIRGSAGKDGSVLNRTTRPSVRSSVGGIH
jgi:hypothetical protein